MENDGLINALTRAEHAMKRIERSLDNRPAPAPAPAAADVELRAKVREAVAELDQLIREAAI